MTTSWHKNAVAITGGIGSGKSSVAALLKAEGAYLVSADAIAREVVAPGSEGLDEVRKAFGDGVIDTSGALDRSRLGELVFSNPALREQLEKITHPRIATRVAQCFASEEAKQASLWVYDVPLLFEAGLDKLGFRKTVCIYAPLPQRIERLSRRDGLSKREIEQRIAAQMPLEEKCQRADIVFDNSGSRAELEKRTKELFQVLKNQGA